jgi:hypothetical protein
MFPFWQILLFATLLCAPVGAVEGDKTVTANVQLDEPHELVAVHVTVVAPAANVEPVAGEQLTTGDGAPVAVGFVHVATELHCEMSEGHAPITGLSLIVTLNVHVDVPQVLVALHVTNVVPVANVEPDAGEHATVGAGAPVAVGSVQLTM